MDAFDIQNGVLVKYRGNDATVHIPQGVSAIDEFAFYGNEDLVELKMSPDVVKVGDSAFYGCENLQSVTFSDRLAEIQSDAFSNCERLASLALPASLRKIGYSAFNGCAIREAIIPDGVQEIGDEAFTFCENLESVFIGKNVAVIGSAPFGYNERLQKIDIHPQNKKFVFRNGCLIDTQEKALLQTLETFEIPDDGSVTVLHEGALAGHDGLKSFELPAFITRIANGRAFADCHNLRKLTVARGNKRYYSQNDCIIDGTEGRLVFGLDPERIPNTDNIKIIGMGAFMETSGATRIVLPRGVEEICDFVFYDFSRLQTVKLPDTLRVIGNNAFTDCAQLQSVHLGAGVKTIGEWAFSGCKSLREIEFPASLQRIGAYAFNEVPLQTAKFQAPKHWMACAYRKPPVKAKLKNPKKAAQLLTQESSEIYFERTDT